MIGDDDSSDEDESYKSCADPLNTLNCGRTSHAERDEEGQGDIDKNGSTSNREVEINSSLRCPPNVSDDSADSSFSDNASDDDIYYSEIENSNNNDDSDISNPSREHVESNSGEVEISFQRELLDYLGSFFNVESSRFRLREQQRQSAAINMSEDQLSEYDRLRVKVHRELKVMGVGQCRDLASSDQNVARNLYLLLAARERGDWTSCRRSSRVVPMWSFEKAVVVAEKEGPTEDLNENLVDLEGQSDVSSDNECDWTYKGVGGKEGHDGDDEGDDKKPRKLVFKNRQKVKYLRDVEEDHRKEVKKKATRVVAAVVEPSCERVQRAGAWDIKSAVYGSRWAVRRLGLEHRFSVHEGCVNALAFSATGAWIASGSDDRHLVITDWQRRRQLSRFSVGHASNVFQVRFLPGSGDLELVSCSRDATVRYAALSSAGHLQYSRLLARHGGYCHKLDVPIDQQSLVLSAGEDACVLAADVRMARSLGRLCRVDQVPLYTICCSPVRSQEFAVAGKDSRVFVFDRRKAGTALLELCPDVLAGKPHSNFHVTSVAYRGDGGALLASYNDDDIYLLSTAAPATATGTITDDIGNNSGDNTIGGGGGGSGGTTLHRYQGHRNVQTVTGVAFYGPQHEYVVSGSNDGHVLMWERDTEALINWFRADENGVVNVLEPHPTLPMLATAGLDHDVKLWSMLAADRCAGTTITGTTATGTTGTCTTNVSGNNGHDDSLSDDDSDEQQQQQRCLPLERPLLQLDAETARIDYAWKRLDEQLVDQQQQPQHECHSDSATVPFNLHNLRVITALNWKMRADAYPYSIDNNLDNLIFMSRRRRGDSQFRGIFISDSDSADSMDSVPEVETLNSDEHNRDMLDPQQQQQSTTVTASAQHQRSNSSPNSATRTNRYLSDTTRPDGCRSS